MDKFDLPPDVDMSKFVMVFAMTVLKLIKIFAVVRRSKRTFARINAPLAACKERKEGWKWL